MDEKRAEKIREWRESLLQLSDDQFFELMRIYLGGIQTPFNKQKLIERLSAFLRKDENLQTIFLLLDEHDKKIASAVHLMKSATIEKLSEFFDGSISFIELCERVSNLEERLVLFKSKNEKIKMNPHVDTLFSDSFCRSTLLEEGKIQTELSEKKENAHFFLSKELLASFIAFVRANPELCKIDGSFKKKTETEMKGIFGEDFLKPLLFVKDALENLGIFLILDDGRHLIDKIRLDSFAKLPFSHCLSYLSANISSRVTLGNLGMQGGLLLSVSQSIPKGGYSRSNLIKCAWLLSFLNAEENGGMGRKSRFSQILARYEKEISTFSLENDTAYISRLIDGAISLGFFSPLGTDKNGEAIFDANPAVFASISQEEKNAPLISVDSAFSVTVFPGLSLSKLISLSEFLEIVHFDTAAIFALTKKSALNAFDLSVCAKEIENRLFELSANPVPQVLSFRLLEWQNEYESATLYSGIVLCVKESEAFRFEENPKLKNRIAKKIASGVYLLDVADEAEAKKILEESGAKSVGNVKKAKKTREEVPFPPIFLRKFEPADELSASKQSAEKSTFHLEKMRSALEKMPLSREEKEVLLFRINRRTILCEEQLRSDSVKFLSLEASGMDFIGKVHIIEQSVGKKIPVELSFKNPPPNGLLVTGYPVSVEKKDADALVMLRLVGTSAVKLYSISQANRVRQVYGSKFQP